MQPAGQSGRGTAGGCLKGWQFHRPDPFSPRSSVASPSLMRCTPDSSGCAVQCFGQYDISRTCAPRAKVHRPASARRMVQHFMEAVRQSVADNLTLA